MITETRACDECQSSNIVHNGKNRAGMPRYKCKDCGVTRVLVSRLASRQLDLAMLERTYLERNSLRATTWIFGVSHFTVYQQLKKKRARQ